MKNLLFTLALLVTLNSFGQTAKEYYEKAETKSSNKDYYGATKKNEYKVSEDIDGEEF